ncbi:hypothetical protein ACRYCC_42545 [Actinomadura scrupuli]|uniref:hypothetical protein n=1 Tax=Actinomadura scrupuli TaxID=559629 RepID=UPI003D979979
MMFLLEEMRGAEEEFRRLRSEGHAKVTVFLTLTGVAVGLVGTISGIKGIDGSAVERVALAAAVVVALIGTNTFVSLVVRDIGTDACARATARVRQYFLARHPDVADHVSWQRIDAPTVWVTRPRSLARRQVSVITAGAWGAAAGTLCLLVLPHDVHRHGAQLSGVDLPGVHLPGALLALGVGVGVAAAAWTLLTRWAGGRFRTVAARAAREQRFHA